MQVASELMSQYSESPEIETSDLSVGVQVDVVVKPDTRTIATQTECKITSKSKATQVGIIPPKVSN